MEAQPLVKIRTELEKTRSLLVEAREKNDQTRRQELMADIRRLVEAERVAEREAEQAAKKEQPAPERLPHSDLPGYEVGPNGAPWRLKAERRKEGWVKLERRKRGRVRYRLTIEGKRRELSILRLLELRKQAEAIWRS